MQPQDETLTHPEQDAPATSSTVSSEEAFESLRQARSKCLMEY